MNSMELTADSVELTADAVDLGGALRLQRVRVQSRKLRANTPFDAGPTTCDLSATLTIAETELNRLVADQAGAGLRDLKVALLNGKVRITGRFEVVGPIAVPFAFVAVPEIDGGERVRLEPVDLSVVGAALPGFSAQAIGERVNARLAEALNVRRAGIPLRLDSIAVETGRLHIGCSAAIDWNPAETGLARAGQ